MHSGPNRTKTDFWSLIAWTRFESGRGWITREDIPFSQEQHNLSNFLAIAAFPRGKKKKKSLENSHVCRFITGRWWELLYAEDRKKEGSPYLPGLLCPSHNSPWADDRGDLPILHLNKCKTTAQTFPTLPLKNVKKTLDHPQESLKKGKCSS